LSTREQSHFPVISKRGKTDLRYALYQAAFIASMRDRHFIVYLTLMKKKEPFNPDSLILE
jgi:hypothetical protein